MPKIFLIKNRLHQQQQRLLESQNYIQQKNRDDERLVPPYSPTPPPNKSSKTRKKGDGTATINDDKDEDKGEVLIEVEVEVEDDSDGDGDGDADQNGNGNGATIKVPPEALSLPPSSSDAHQSEETLAPQNLVLNCNSSATSISTSASLSTFPSSSLSKLLVDYSRTSALTFGKLQRRVQSSRSRSISPAIGVSRSNKQHRQTQDEQDEPLSLVATKNNSNCNCNCNSGKIESTTLRQRIPCRPTHSTDGHGQETWPRESSHHDKADNNADKHFTGK